jgi:TolA-binding protein
MTQTTCPTLQIRAAMFALALAFTAAAHAQEPVASPSVSPAPSPAPVASPVVSARPLVLVDPVIDLNAAAIEAVIERAHNQAMREASMEAEVAAYEAIHEGQETQREKELEARERAREQAREARDQAREAAREAREAERESQRDRAESLEELYESAMESIDEEDWSDALRPLSRLMSLNSRVDAALYWTGYAQGKMNRAAAALATLARLQAEFPASRWAKEAKALEMEVRGKSGQAPRPDQEDDLDLKLMAVSALAQSDPSEAMPMLVKILSSPNSSRKVRERSLFVLAQIGSVEAGNAIAEVARGNQSPELQRKAIQYLGVFGGPNNRKILSDVYASTTDNTLRKRILNSFMVSGDKARVLNAARNEKDPSLRADAVRLLGVMGGTAELSQMYSTAVSTEEKKAILQALFIGGAIEQVAAAARGEKDKEARLAAVRNLGLMGRRSENVLTEMYRSETDFEVKKEILNAFFLQGNPTRLVEIARAEKDPGLKKEAVHWLSLMNSKESRAFMLELLKD